MPILAAAHRRGDFARTSTKYYDDDQNPPDGVEL
jgi:hypothetical protein